MRRNSSIALAFAGVGLVAALVPAMAASADDATATPLAAATPSGSPTPSPTDTASAATGDQSEAAASPNAAPEPVDDVAVVRWGASVNIAVLDNDTDPDGDPLELLDVTTGTLGTAVVQGDVVHYTPSGSGVGDDVLTYTVIDDHDNEATATVTVAVGRKHAIRLRVRARPHVLKELTITGVVTPVDDELPRVKLYRRIGGSWTQVSMPTVRSDGTFSRAWLPETPGFFRWRARAEWSDGSLVTSTVERVHVIARLDAAIHAVKRHDVPYTWRRACPVGPSQLRAIEMNYWDYRGHVRRGTLIGSSWAVQDYLFAFRAALRGHFAIKKLTPADTYHGIDERAMAAGATSAFNCRHVTGNPYRMSQHSWGDAVDINPFENPYVTTSRVYPAAAAMRYYRHRGQHLHDPGVITSNSVIARALYHQGWAWGARWSNPDFQHWSRNGG